MNQTRELLLRYYVDWQLQIIDEMKDHLRDGKRDAALYRLLDRWYFLQRLIREVS